MFIPIGGNIEKYGIGYIIPFLNVRNKIYDPDRLIYIDDSDLFI
jgi:hypothetical protein